MHTLIDNILYTKKKITEEKKPASNSSVSLYTLLITYKLVLRI